MLKSRNKESKIEGKARDRKSRELLGDDVTVYTTAYGTQYVLTTDLLFSQEEKREFLEEAEKRAALSE